MQRPVTANFLSVAEPDHLPMLHVQNSIIEAGLSCARRCWVAALAVLLLAAVPAGAQQKATTSTPRVEKIALAAPSLQSVAWSVLEKGIAAGKASERADAIAALSSIGPNPRSIGMIMAALRDSSASVREKAVAALDNLQVHSAIPQLRAALHDPSAPVSFTAAKALWDMGDPGGRDILIAVLQGKRRGTPAAWQSQLQQTGAQLRSPVTLGLLGAQEAAGVFFGPAAIGVAMLGQMLRDHGAPDRAFSAEMLGLDPSPQATAALFNAARDKNWMVRASAAEGLGNVDRPNAGAVLQRLLRDSKSPVRFMAASAVIRLQAASRRQGGSGSEEAANK